MRLILNILFFLTDEVLEVRYKEPGKYTSTGLSTDWIAEETPLGTRHIIILKPSLSARIGKLTLRHKYDFQDEDRVFVNGYQSWTESREYSLAESIPKLKGPGRGKMERTGDYTFFNYSGESGQFHSYTYTYIRDQENQILLFGSLDETSGYTVLEYDVSGRELTLGKALDSLVIDAPYKAMEFFVGKGREKEVFDEWFRLQNLPDLNAQPMVGWTSWYYHYTKISEEIIEENLEAFASRNIPIDLFQIDDGWQVAVGDWLEANQKFPKGMKLLADSIHVQGYKAGLWLAPFIVEKKSEIFRKHRDWLVTYDGEHLVKAGYNPLWGGILNGNYFILDLRLKAVRKYLTTVMDVILNQWGFDLVKLDFLYAAALIPLSNKSRGQLMTEAMAFLRKICGNKLILGCGVPLGPAFGKVDYCRVGCDTHRDWDMTFLRRAGLRERISTINSLKDSIGRRHLDHRGFLNDPDVYILRSEEHKLLVSQQLTLFMVNQIFGSLVLTSDNIENYNPETMRLFRKQFPIKRKKILKVKEKELLKLVWFMIEEREYFAAVNLGDNPVVFYLESGLWYETNEGFVEGGNDVQLGAFATKCFFKSGVEPFQVVGSSGHVFPGSEVKSLEFAKGELQIEWEEKNGGEGDLLVRVGPGSLEIKVNGVSREVKEIKGKKILQIPVGS